MRRTDYFLSSLLLLPVIIQFSCRAVGPDYKKPTIPAPPNWNAPLSEGLGPAAVTDDTLAHWWTTLNDSMLESLIDRAVRGNLDLRRAEVALRQARAERGVAQADRFPTVTASGFAGYNRVSDKMGTGGNIGLFTSGFDAGWEADFFGGVRRSIEAADATLEARQESLRDVLVSLIAEVALNYVEVRQSQRQLAIAENNLGIQEDSLRLAQQRYDAGLTSRFDVDQATYAVADTRSRIPVLQTGLEQAKNRLAVLLGINPGDLSNELRQAAPIPVAPPQIAVGIPADALRRRPDVRRAERLLAAQTARIGVATAARYPRLGLAGSIGYDFLTKGNPLSPGNLLGAFGVTAFYTLFDAGRLRQQVEIQNALQEQAFLDYQSSILLSLEDVEDALRAYADQQVRRRSLVEAAEAAARAVEVVRTNYVAGLVDFQPVLESQRSLLSFQDQLAQTDGAVTSELIRLYKALGGGWSPLAPQPAPGRP